MRGKKKKKQNLPLAIANEKCLRISQSETKHLDQKDEIFKKRFQEKKKRLIKQTK